MGFQYQSYGPSLTLLGPATLSVLENFYGAGQNSLTLDVGLSDGITLAPNMQLTASSPDGTLATGTIVEDPGNPLAGTDIVTFTPGAFRTGNVPITLTLTDGGGTSVTQTVTVDILPVDPAPAFVQQIGPISMREGPDATTKGSLGYPLYLYVDDLTPNGVDDSGSLIITATSSNPTLIANGDIVVTPIAGVPSAHTLNVFSEPGHYGSANITLTASDGTVSSSEVVAVTVNEVAIAPQITAPASVSYKESSVSQTLSIPITVLDPNAPPVVTVSDKSAPSGWSSPTLTIGANGHDTIQMVVAPFTYTSGTLSIAATSSQGTAGTLQSFFDLPIAGIQQHLNFTIPPTQSFSIREGDGGAVLFGFGNVPITGDTGDTFTFKIVSGDPPVSATDPTPLYSISSAGILYADSAPTWSPTSTNRHVLGVQVYNGVYGRSEAVTVTVVDNSPPVLSLTETPATRTAPPHPVTTAGSVTITASDPHDLALSLAITAQTDASGAKPYFIGPVTKTGNIYTAAISVLPTAPITHVADTLTISATDSQGLVSSQTISFLPDMIHKLPAGGAGVPDATSPLHEGAYGRPSLQANNEPLWEYGLMVSHSLA